MKTFEQIMTDQRAWAREHLPALEDFDGPGMLARSLAAGNVMWRALAVLTRDNRSREWLEANDPQALGQALAAMELWTEEHPALDTRPPERVVELEPATLSEQCAKCGVQTCRRFRIGATLRFACSEQHARREGR